MSFQGKRFGLLGIYAFTLDSVAKHASLRCRSMHQAAQILSDSASEKLEESLRLHDIHSLIRHK